MRAPEAIRRGIWRRRPWTPLQLPSAALWWDASQGVTQSSGLVSSWADRIAGQTVTQSTGSLKPVYSATSLNGLDGITFDGSDDNLARGSIPTGAPTGANAGWIFALVDQQKPTGTTAAGYVGAYGSTAASAGRDLYRIVSGGVNRLVAENESHAVTEGTVDFTGVHAVFALFGAASTTARIDGAESATDNTAVNTATTRMRIGAWIDVSATGFFLGTIGHLVIGTGTLTTAEKERLEAWALWSVNKSSQLPANHTYKTQRPLAQLAHNDNWTARGGLLVPRRFAA